MRLEFTLAGVSPLIMHNGAAGLDTRSALRREIAALTAKRGGNGTAVDDQRPWEVECRRSLYLDADGRPTLREAALRRMIENGARKTKQGGLVREGLMIESVTFRYEVERYGTDVEAARPLRAWQWTWLSSDARLRRVPRLNLPALDLRFSRASRNRRGTTNHGRGGCRRDNRERQPGGRTRVTPRRHAPALRDGLSPLRRQGRRYHPLHRPEAGSR